MGRRARSGRRWRVLIASMLAVTTIGIGPASGTIEDLLSSSTLLREGQSGSLVTDLQRALSSAGHSPGPADGIFGPMTRSAVRSFQAAAGIGVDGLVGPATRRAIATALSVPGGTGTTGTTTTTSRGSLSPGARGPSVVALQRELARTGFYRGPIDGDFGPMTSSAVVAFHKIWGRDRTSTWNSSDWDRISGWYPRAPGYGSAAFRLEIDLSRQLLFVIRNGSVAAVMPMSSGNGEYYTNYAGNRVRAWTPKGNYTTYRYVNGWDNSYLGELWEPWYFYGGYAVHGSNFVPPYPASHGCVRLSIADMAWLDARMWIGMPVHVWD